MFQHPRYCTLDPDIGVSFQFMVVCVYVYIYMYTRVHLLAYRRSYRSLSNFNVKGMFNAMGP